MHETRTRSPTRTFFTPAPIDLDGADGLVPEDPAVGDGRDVALEDVQVGAADRHRIDADDGVGVVDDDGLRDFLPGLLARTVVHDGLHGDLLSDPIESDRGSLESTLRTVRDAG